jgi:hypothetical protein
MTQLPLWRDTKKKSKYISWIGPVLAGDRLILANTRGSLLNVAIADGKIGNGTNVGDDVYLPPVVANNTLYILDAKGHLSAWR